MSWPVRYGYPQFLVGDRIAWYLTVRNYEWSGWDKTGTYRYYCVNHFTGKSEWLTEQELTEIDNHTFQKIKP